MDFKITLLVVYVTLTVADEKVINIGELVDF